MKHLSETVKNALLRERKELVVQRDLAARSLEMKIAEIDSHLGEYGIYIEKTSIAAEVAEQEDSDISMTKQIKEFAKDMITPGVFVKTESIYQAMKDRGIDLPPTGSGKPPAARITRILSSTKLYKGHKTHGWSLKENDPVGAGS